MRPVLYSENAEYRICTLSDTLECIVREEHNSIYELEMTYLLGGRYANQIIKGRYISAKANATTDAQLFKIYSVSTSLTGDITVKAEHISYQLKGYPLPLINNFVYSSIADVISYIKNNTHFGVGDFTIRGQTFNEIHSLSADIIKSVSDLLFSETGLCKKHGLSAFRNNKNISLQTINTEGVAVPYVRYGVNLADYQCTINEDNVYNCVFPYYIYSYTDSDDKKLITIANQTLDSANDIKDISNYYFLPNYHENDELKCYLFNVADYISDRYIIDTISSSGYINLLPACENYVEEHLSELTQPSITTTIDFVNLADTINYKNIAKLQNVGMNDYVIVLIPHLNISAKVQVISYEYNSLLERYNSITLENIETKLTNLISSLSNRQTSLSNNINTVSSISYITSSELNGVNIMLQNRLDGVT